MKLDITSYMLGKKAGGGSGGSGGGEYEQSLLKVLERRSEITSFTFPKGIKKIGICAFRYCDIKITELPDTITEFANNAFEECGIRLTKLPANLVRIGNSVFSWCNITVKQIPSGVNFIGDYAFNCCNALTEITFMGKPSTISGTAFNACANLTTINVPWAEGEVANAPWGATNATINYNYTGE